MKLVIKNKEGKSYFSTEYESCVPVDKLDSLNHSGYQFFLDGKKVSLSTMKSTFSTIPELEIYQHTSDNVEESDITIHKYGDSKKDRYPVEVISREVFGSKHVENITEVSVDTAVESIDIVDKESPKSEEVVVDSFNIDLSSIGFPVNSRTIVCLNNGKVYKTQKEAGEDLDIDPVNISYSISTDKPYKGYTFKKAMEFVK